MLRATASTTASALRRYLAATRLPAAAAAAAAAAATATRRRFADYKRAEIRTQTTRNAPPRDHTPAAATADEDAEAGGARAGRAYVPDLIPLFDAPSHFQARESATGAVEDKLRGTILEAPQLREPLRSIGPCS
ncbi:hypothetical protein AMAG_01956 [Allomyces macrogynus ATCC 38327]|uniref:Uncharacterized protein n=1 Tax=Allomyces macrogynus (strain ATCC 38327) TaxID=578462 RepID=A0A0L0S0N7_ALLM3|nr:hypothetical protein AMAG_01956 [Allomyces macrogynus ATCC 38327]|eukprot:KNE56118.1 hypothetical protein AMAG_01956 [Allomyces macrogynus ATCC 38327]